MVAIRPWQAWLALALAASLSIPPAAAQDPGAPPPSATANILYAHHHDSDTEEVNGWMNTLVTDPTGNDIALGPTTVPCCPEARVYTITLAPALSAPFTLDPTGNIVIDAYIGAGGSQGVVRVSTELRYGGELVASGTAQNHVYEQAGTGPYPKVTWTIAPEITEFAPGNDLVWTISLTGVAVQTVFLSVSEERGSSGITLPILTGGESAPAPDNGAGNSTTNSTTTTGSTSDTSTASATSTSASLSGTATTTSSTTTAAADSDNTTTNASRGDSQDSPAPPLAAAGLALFAVAAAVRRRLR